MTRHSHPGLVIALTLASIGIVPIGSAKAQDPSVTEREQQARAHAATGRNHQYERPEGDPEGYAKCAQTLLELIADEEAKPDHPDLVLWNAAYCSRAAGLGGQAIDLWMLLLERHPDSEFAQDSLEQLAEEYQATAQYDESAQYHEQYVEQYGKESRAAGGLYNAYLFRLGLGQVDAAKRDLAQYEHLYRKNGAERITTMFWMQVDLLETLDQRRAHALAYLEKYGTKGGLDRAIVADALIAQIDWRRSCSEPLLLDSCISSSRRIAHFHRHNLPDPPSQTYQPPERCRSFEPVITVYRRDAKLSAAAQRRFARIQKLMSHNKVAIPEIDTRRLAAFKHAWGMAVFYATDAKYEDFLRREPPEGLDFTIEEWRKESGVPAWEKQYAAQLATAQKSHARLREFVAEQSQLVAELEDRYFMVRQTLSPDWTLAAFARNASVNEYAAAGLRRAKLPRRLDSEDAVRAYCDALAGHAEPFEDRALQSWVYCLDHSTEYLYHDEFTHLCEIEAAAADPENYSVTRELFGQPTYAGTGISSVGVLADPSDADQPTSAE